MSTNRYMQQNCQTFQERLFHGWEGSRGIKRSPVSLFITKINEVAICNFMEDGAI